MLSIFLICKTVVFCFRFSLFLFEEVFFPPAFVFGVLNDKWMLGVNIKIQSAYQSFRRDQLNAELFLVIIEIY